MRHIGDGDADDEAAGILLIRVGLGVDGVVVVLGIGGIDGDQRQVAPILAPGQRGGPARIRLLEHVGGKDMRDAMGVDGDQADRVLAPERAEPLRRRGAVARP